MWPTCLIQTIDPIAVGVRGQVDAHLQGGDLRLQVLNLRLRRGGHFC